VGLIGDVPYLMAQSPNGLIEVMWYALVFTERNGKIRPISLRKAEKSENLLIVYSAPNRL